MNYEASIADREHKQLLLRAANDTASLAATVERIPTLNPGQREAAERLAKACSDVRNVFEPTTGA